MLRREGGRQRGETREITLDSNISLHAEGSCLVKFGNTHVLCSATIDENLPPFLRGKGQGWITAEYGMLPRSTHARMKREAAQGKQSGRTQEIQRLIARSLRAAVDLKVLGERQIIIDCDVIQADGGTRTASITGGFIALYGAVHNLMKRRMLGRNPIMQEVAAISCGIIDGEIYVDLDYNEDSNAEVDANFVMTGNNTIVEIQSSAEQVAFTSSQFQEMFTSANKAINEIIELQRAAINADFR